ncbi:MAG: ribosomal protein S18-alanine N-acetyltransferase [Candidatus Marinimicrobia bacterium]|nr:ribosomal protein S18-alanine N-acetyltransferase [Candidatus Neomarinimicrobiota bacterium]
MKPRIVIRTVKITDLPQIMDIERRVFPHPWTEAHLMFEITNKPVSGTTVALIDNEIVGYLMYHLIYDVVHINNIAVDSTRQRKGVGRLLMESFYRYLPERQPCNIFLEVDQTNQAAIRFYKKFGFEEIDRRKNYYPAGGDALVMKKKLENYGLVQA